MRLAKTVFAIFLLSALPLLADGFTPTTALLSNSGSTARTAPGAPITTQNDNMRMEATVKWLGPANRGSLIVYNGNGCCNGWGILQLASTDTPPNVLSVLAGGITIAISNITLTPNTWQHVSMDRVGQVVTITLSSAEPDDHTAPQTFSFGVIPSNPIGFFAPSQTIVGDAFNGFITSATFTDLSGPSVIESWDFTHAPGAFSKLLNLYGPTATGVNGNVLNLTSSWAVPARGNP